mgnify:CR=1 FL=1
MNAANMLLCRNLALEYNFFQQRDDSSQGDIKFLTKRFHYVANWGLQTANFTNNTKQPL